MREVQITDLLSRMKQRQMLTEYISEPLFENWWAGPGYQDESLDHVNRYQSVTENIEL